MYPGQPVWGPSLRWAGTFNKIRGPPKRCFLEPASRMWKCRLAVLVRIETYTIVESNSKFFIPPAIVVCVVGRHRDPPSTSQSVTSTFPPLCRESRFAITITQIYEQLSLEIYTDSLSVRMLKKISPISIFNPNRFLSCRIHFKLPHYISNSLLFLVKFYCIS